MKRNLGLQTLCLENRYKEAELASLPSPERHRSTYHQTTTSNLWKQFCRLDRQLRQLESI